MSMWIYTWRQVATHIRPRILRGFEKILWNCLPFTTKWQGIAESFTALSLEQVFGAVAFYLANRESIDAYLRGGRAEFARMRDEARRKHPALYSKLEAARHGAPSRSA